MTQSDQQPDAIQRAHDTIRSTLANIGQVADSLAERVRGIINDELKAIFDPLGAALQAQLHVLGDLVSGLLENLATPDDILKQLVATWTGVQQAAETPADAVLKFASQDTPQALGDFLNEKLAKTLHEWFAQSVPDAPNSLDPETIREAFGSMPLLVKGPAQLAITLLTATAFLAALNTANIRLAEQASLEDHQPTPLTPAELANAVVQNQIDPNEAWREAQFSGVNQHRFQVMVDTAGLPPGVGELLQLWNRGVIKEPDVEQGIREGHTKDKYIQSLKELRWWLPTPADLVHWLTREVWVDEFVQRFGMDQELNQQIKNAQPYFTANAVRDELVKLFWRAHWTLPSPSMGEEMFHRTDPNGAGETISLPGGGTTKRVIGRADLLRLYRAAGFEPYWRDPMIRVAFNPLTRIDSRRMYLQGTIDDARLFSSYLDLGYSEADAGLFVSWMQANKAAQQKAQVEKHITPITTALKNAYKRGQLNAIDFKTRAVQLGEDGDVVDVWIAQLDAERETDRADRLRDGVHRLFVDGFISEDEAGSRLQAEGFTSAEWMRLRDDWRIDSEFRTASDDAKAARALTRQNLITAYRDQLIQEPELRQRLTSMGYHQDEQDLWIGIANFEGAQRIANTAREGIHEDYVDQLIDAAAVRDQLAQIGTPTEAIEAYVRRWTSERRRKTPSISVGQIESAFKNETLAEDKARDLLKQLRYTPDEIDVLIGAWSKDLSISEQRLALQQQRAQAQAEQFAAREQASATRSEAARAESQRRQAQQESFAQAQQARTLEAETTRAAAAFERASQRQATTIQAAADRQARTLAQAQDREAKQLAERDKALAQAQLLRQQAQEATNARQQASLQASADRQQRTFEQQDKLYQARVADRVVAEQRAQGYKLAAEGRQQQYQQAKEGRVNALKIQTELRANRRELEKELRQQSFVQAREQRQQEFKLAGEQRLSERKGALAQAQAQAESAIADLRLKQQSTAGQSAQDILNQVEQQIQAQIGSLPSGQ